MNSHRPLLAAALCLLALPALALKPEDLPEDVLEGAKEHPAIRNYPGSLITWERKEAFEEFAFPLATKGDETVTKKISGTFFSQKVFFPEGLSCTALLGNYENAFNKAGMVVHKGTSALDMPRSPDECPWVSAEGKDKGTGAPLFAAQNCCKGTPSWGGLVVVTARALEQRVEIDADGIAQELEKSGRVALYGINFATGKADITADSAKALSDIATVLKGHAAWKLRVEGHTDDVGKPAANLELSRKRAAAVKDWLVKKHGVDAARLSTEGFGQEKPLSPNDSDANRARNRRVELVKL